MLYNNKSIAQVAETLQGGYQLVVVALVQTYGGLVQNIEYTHKGGSYLGGETYALALAAAESSRGTGQGKVFQSHAFEESQTGLYFLDYLTAYHFVAL